MLRRVEVGTNGINEVNQGLSTDPYASNPFPTSLGLRIPPVLSDASTPDTQPRYLFLLASMTISRGVVYVRGIRQGLTIGTDFYTPEGLSSYPIELMVTTPFWRFIDGNVSWHLVREPQMPTVTRRPNSDAASWAYKESTTAAMLYQSATFSAGNFNTRNGAPNFYPVGLTAYVPPSPSGWQPIAGLGNLKEVRFPYNRPTEAGAINEVVEGACRVSLYASVLQTNPLTRASLSLPAASSIYPSSITPELGFQQSFQAVQYWRVFGSLILDVEGEITGG